MQAFFAISFFTARVANLQVTQNFSLDLNSSVELPHKCATKTYYLISFGMSGIFQDFGEMSLGSHN